MNVLKADEIRQLSSSNRPELIRKTTEETNKSIRQAAESALTSVRVFVPVEVLTEVVNLYSSQGFRVKASLCGDTNLLIQW